MKKNITLLLFFALFGISLFGQTYRNPESIVYDTSQNRYFISNKGGNSIVVLAEDGTQTDFVTVGLAAPKGLLITGDTLIVVNSYEIHGYNIEDTSLIFNYAVENSSFMNDATTDGKGILYISDTGEGKIYKMNLTDGSNHTIVDGNINPNGMLFDEASNSFVFCNWEENARIHSFNISDSSLSVLTTTNLTNLDGIARDNCGNIYVSAWENQSVYAFDPEFQLPPTLIKNRLGGPADISINEDQVLAIPNYSQNLLRFVELGMDCAAEINIISPENNTIWPYDSILFIWDALEGVSNYELQYSKDSLFTSGVTSHELYNNSTVITGLDLDATYYWRLRTLDGDYKKIFKNIWSFHTQTPTGISKSISKKKLHIYPNPAQDKIFICNTIQLNNTSSYQLLSYAGQIVKQGLLNSHTINIATLQSGVYFLAVITDKEKHTVQIIIE
jgi:hypothetical protein